MYLNPPTNVNIYTHKHTKVNQLSEGLKTKQMWLTYLNFVICNGASLASCWGAFALGFPEHTDTTRTEQKCLITREEMNIHIFVFVMRDGDNISTLVLVMSLSWCGCQGNVFLVRKLKCCPHQPESWDLVAWPGSHATLRECGAWTLWERHLTSGVV